METVKLSTKGQIVIPKGIRESRHLSAGTEFAVVCLGDEIHLKPLPAFAPTRAEDGVGLLARKGRTRLGDQETDRAIGALLKDADEATKA